MMLIGLPSTAPTTEAQAISRLDSAIGQWIIAAQMWRQHGIQPLETYLSYCGDGPLADERRIDFIGYATLFEIEQQRVAAALRDAQDMLERPTP
jgi:hypothetical protein